MTRELRQVYEMTGPEDMWLGDHSFSHLSLGEFKAYDWEKIDCGFFAERIKLLDKLGSPDSVRVVFGFDS